VTIAADATCPVCGSRETSMLGPPVYRRPTAVGGVPIDLTDLDLTWRRCGRCGYWFVHPGIPEDRLLRCYAAAPSGHWDTDAGVAGVRLYEQKKRLLERFAPPGKRVLDFGCFDGGFLEYLGSAYEKLGIEPAADAARVAEQRGVQILGLTIAQSRRDVPPVDAIVALDVFEHLSDPVGVLRGLRQFLRPGGVVLIETGDTDAPGFQRHGVRYTYAGLVEHVGLFNQSSIREAGRAAGFALAHFERSWHHAITPAQHVEYRLYNAAYQMLRGLSRAKIPLTSRLDRVSRGPLPWGTRADHFLAVLRA
jgi:SAM-dependent methyltransferase